MDAGPRPQLRTALGLERGGGPGLRRLPGVSWLQGHRSSSGVPGGRRGHGSGDVELRGLGSSGLRRRSSRRPARCSARRAIFPRSRRCWPPSRHRAHRRASSSPAARPATGRRRPATICRRAYHLWLFGDQVEHGRSRGATRTRSSPEPQPTVNPAVWPYGIVFWPLYHVFGPRARLEPVRPAHVRRRRPARHRRGCASSASRRVAGARGRARLRDRPVPGGAEPRAPARADHRCCSRSRSGRSNAGGGATRPGSRSPPSSLASIPLSGQVHFAIGARSRSTPRMRSSGCRP